MAIHHNRRAMGAVAPDHAVRPVEPQVDFPGAPVCPESQPTRIVAVLFSGGDAPGMNAFLRFFVRLGLHRHRAQVLGVKDGYAGLVRTAATIQSGTVQLETFLQQITDRAGAASPFDRSLDLLNLDHTSVSGLASRGGINLGAARCPEFQSAEVRKHVFELLGALGVHSLVAVGGNGTLAGARAFAAETGMQVVGVPATIDNDVDCSETALGFDTAVNIAMHAIEQLNDTAGSHHRIMVVETMGRDCGHLARMAGLTGGAEIVVTSERGLLSEDKMQGIARRLEGSLVLGQTHAIVVVAEGVKTADPAKGGPAAVLRTCLEQHFARGDCPFRGIEVRETVLGHVQRGGSPSAADRLLAAQFADAVWSVIMSSPARSGIAVVRRGRTEIRSFDDPPATDVALLQEVLYGVQKAVTSWG